ncbi:hypothetical protein GQ43DRAFT_347341, partial [Delitschia confertaspora ATCC 74209]
ISPKNLLAYFNIKPNILCTVGNEIAYTMFAAVVFTLQSELDTASGKPLVIPQASLNGQSIQGIGDRIMQMEPTREPPLFSCGLFCTKYDSFENVRPNSSIFVGCNTC